MKRSLIALSLAGLSLAGLGLVASGCSRADASQQKPVVASAPNAAAVRVVAPIQRLEHAATAASGQVRSQREATLSARVSGTISSFNVEVGDRVAAGQALVALDDGTARASLALAAASLDGARSDLRMAELELERQKALIAGNAAPRAQLERAQATRDAAAARVASAEASHAIAARTVADHQVRAPFAGVITAKLKQAGESVSAMPPTALVSIVDTANLEVRLDVSEASVDTLRKGMGVTGTVSPSGQPFEAKVKAIGAAVDPKSRTVEVLLAISPSGSVRGAALRSGALVSVQLASAEALAGPFVPASAVQAAADGAFVWVIQEGRLQRRAVQGAPHGQELFRVASGLTGKESVVVSDPGTLRDGAPVRAVN
jgi:RND family efflux transporter MFP subunit